MVLVRSVKRSYILKGGGGTCLGMRRARHVGQYSTVQYRTVQCSTVQHSTVQHSTVQYSTVQYSTVQYSTVQYSTVQYSTVQYSTVQYSAVQCSTWLKNEISSANTLTSLLLHPASSGSRTTTAELRSCKPHTIHETTKGLG